MYNGIRHLRDDCKVKIYVNGILDYVGSWKDFLFKDYIVAKDVLMLSAAETADYVIIGYYKDL